MTNLQKQFVFVITILFVPMFIAGIIVSGPWVMLTVTGIFVGYLVTLGGLMWIASRIWPVED